MRGDIRVSEPISKVYLGDICQFHYGKSLVKSAREEEGNYYVYGSNGIVGNHSEFLVNEPCIIIGRKGAAGEVHLSPHPCWPIDTTYFVIENEKYLLKYLYYQLKALQLSTLDKSTAIPGLNRNDAYRKQIYFPSKSKQQLIVEKIEELFSEIDKGIENLKTAQQQLKVYRQSVLKWAFEGRLTNEYVKNGELPEGWEWKKLDLLGQLGRGKSKHRPRNDKSLFGGKYPFIQTSEVKSAVHTIKSYINTYSEVGLKQSKLWQIGTLCITIAANIAEVAFLGFDACFPDSIVGFTADRNLVKKEFIYYFFKANQSKLEAFAPATAQKNINLTTLENLIIPYCSPDEQTKVIQEIESRLSVCDKMEEAIVDSLQQAEVLKQSILKKAFEGKLLRDLNIN